MTESRTWMSGPSSIWMAGVTLPASWTSQTSDGITIASSFKTRSQSKRLCARLATVPARISSIAPNWAKALRLWAFAVVASSSWLRLATSVFLSEIPLLVKATAITPSRARQSAPSRTYGTPPVRILVPSPRRASGGIRLTERIA